MKEAIVWNALSALGWGVAWVVVLVAGLVASAFVRHAPLKASLVVGAVFGVPAMFFLIGLAEDAKSAAADRGRREQGTKLTEAFARLCAATPPLPQTPVAPDASLEGVDLLVREAPAGLYDTALDVTSILHDSCWFIANGQCPMAPLKNVKWQYQLNACAPGQECVVRVNYDVARQERKDVESIGARFALDVARPDVLAPDIYRFHLSVVDTETGRVLGDTYVHKIGPVPLGAPAGMSTCPQQGAAISELLRRTLVPIATPSSRS